MKIATKLQAIAYSTVVTISVTIGGALWWNRTGPDATIMKVDDYIEIYQGCLERCMVTEIANDPQVVITNNVYTNDVMDWIVDPSGRGFYYYSTNGTTAAWTNYKIGDGYTASCVYTDNFGSHSYRVSLPDTGSGEMTGGTNRYIWNAYSNLTISGYVRLPTYINGEYVYYTNGYTMDLEDWFYDEWGGRLFNFYGDYTGYGDSKPINAMVYIYTNITSAGQTWFFDFGPLKTIAEDAQSCAIGVWDDGYGMWFLEAWTRRGDSMFNGPWYNYSGDEEINFSVVGSSFASNLLRDATCRWIINKGEYPTGEEKYYRSNFHGIGPRLTRMQLDTIEDKLLRQTGSSFLLDCLTPAWHLHTGSYPEENYEDGSRYIDISSASSGEFVGFTSVQQFYDLSTNVTMDAVCDWAGVARKGAWTNSAIPSADDFTRLYKIIRQFRWTRLGRNYGIHLDVYRKWFAHGYIGGDSGTTYSNIWYGSGSSAISWDDAKNIALTDFHCIGVSSPGRSPWSFTKGFYRQYTLSSERWIARIQKANADLCYVGACTSITHTADFYVYGYPENSDDGTNVVVFDDNGTGLVAGQYKRIGTIEDGIDANPYWSMGSNTNTPIWCDDPKPTTGNKVQTDYSSYKGYGGSHGPPAEIIMKWDFQYCTNDI